MKGTIPMTTNTKTVAFVNLKGGVGKTTSAIGTAEALARLGHTVTVRDADRPARRPCGRTRPYRPAAHCLRGGGRQPVHRRRARRGGMGADRHASLADRSGGGGGGRGRPRAARHHHRPHRPGTHAGDHPADQQALLGAADPDPLRHAQPQARRGVPGRERTGPMPRDHPVQGGHASRIGRGPVPVRLGLRLIAKELSDAFAA